jgi:hypothetical protein
MLISLKIYYDAHGNFLSREAEELYKTYYDPSFYRFIEFIYCI